MLKKVLFEKEVYLNMLEEYKNVSYFEHGEDHGFAFDGPVCTDKWKSKNCFTEPKLLFLAKETYGYDGDDKFEIMDNPDRYNASKTDLLIAKISWCVNKIYACILSNNIVFNQQVIFEYLDNITYQLEMVDETHLKESYSDIAVIEVKKLSGESKSDDTDIRNHSYRNRQFLARQIEYLSPDIIFCCGKVTWQSLTVDMSLFNLHKFIPEITAESRAYLCDDIVLYNSYHPSYRFFNMYDALYDIFECLVLKMKSK